MSELIEFKYVNDSLTTISQSRLISKLATYFKIPQKQLRECLDKNRIKDEAIISFNCSPIDLGEYYVANFHLNIGDILNPNRFNKSVFAREYITAKSNKGRGGANFVVYDTSLFVIYDVKRLNFNGKSVGGIYLNYPDFENQIILPIDSFLELVYPLPSI